LAFNTLDSVLRRNVYRVDLKTNGRRVLRASKQCGDASNNDTFQRSIQPARKGMSR
jgi:hypothetical protein